ncbi:MAG: response regulator [Gemmataceae bacterium]|nr:response regulator [Gemmataceae bacterium]
MTHPPDPRPVLVVDDDPDVRRVIELLVGRLGFPVLAAGDGPAGVGLFRDHAAGVAAVLLDVRMPGMDGPQALAELRAIDPAVRCYFVTGDAGDRTDADLVALGAVGVLRKPVRLEHLAAALAATPAAVGPARPGPEPMPMTTTLLHEPPRLLDLDGQPRLSVLVVEDCPDTAASMVELLRLTGYDAAAAASGPAALELADGVPPDVALIDLWLPGMDGCEVARRLRDRCPRKRPLLVAVTGCGTDADRRRTALAGFDLHLTKPVDPDLLFRVLGRFARLLAPPARA